jgi:hypothetical protein
MTTEVQDDRQLGPAPHNDQVFSWEQYPSMDALEAIAADRATATCYHTYPNGDYTTFRLCGAPATCFMEYEHMWDSASGVLMGRWIKVPLCPFHGTVADQGGDAVIAWTDVAPRPYYLSLEEPPF